jgi:nocardicin nonribosomal peptide synthetase NocB
MRIDSSSTKPFESPIIPIQEGNDDPVLFLIHPGGGLAFCYSGLAKYIDTPIYGINNPHFTNPENGFNSIEEIAEYYIKLIKDIQEVGPYYLGGWSFGGLVALEMSHQLSFQQEEVKRLILIDSGNPIKPPRKFLEDTKQEILVENQDKNENNDFIFPQELKNLMGRNLSTCGFKYAAPRYKGEVFLLRAENKNKFGKKIRHQTNSHGWKGYIDHLKILDIPGEHVNLFDHEYIKSTAEAIKFTLSSTTIEKITAMEEL